MKTFGLDVGSITTKAVVMEDGRLLGARISLTGYNAQAAGREVFEKLLGELGLNPDAGDRIVSTGYGRHSIEFADKAITEIICHGAGANYLNPEVRSLVDIGGQDSKAILLDGQGQVKNFVMNDKCAAGTGRFLEVMAGALQVELRELGPMSLKAEAPARISSTCTVFAESEVISLIAKGEPRQSIAAGIHEAVAARVAAMAKRIGLTGPLMMTGGVAKNIGVVKALEKKLELEIQVPEAAQINGAIGAALLARDL